MEKPHTAALFVRPGADGDHVYLNQAVRVLRDADVTPLLPMEAEASIDPSCRGAVSFLRGEEEMIEKAEMLLVLGGDGTMIDYTVKAAMQHKPVCGVNLGTLGFLTALERHEMARLSALGSGEYAIEERMLLDVRIEARGELLWQGHVLNDLVVASGVRSKIAEFSLYSQKGKLLDYRADGLILATPTGSTAYSFSAGGPVIDPTAKIISLIPICPHSLLRRAVLLSPDTELLVRGRTRDEMTDIHVTMDGKDATLIPSDAEIRVRTSPYTASIVKLGENRFYDILETKFNRK